jgi:hypothetical protein
MILAIVIELGAIVVLLGLILFCAVAGVLRLYGYQ